MRQVNQVRWKEAQEPLVVGKKVSLKPPLFHEDVIRSGSKGLETSSSSFPTVVVSISWDNSSRWRKEEYELKM